MTPAIAEHVRLRLFPTADPRRHDIVEASIGQQGSVLLRRDDSAVSHGCGATLLEGRRLDRLPEKVFHCPACGTFCSP